MSHRSESTPVDEACFVTGVGATAYSASMSPPEINIERIDASELNTAVAVATRAFWDDPMFGFFTPDLLAQHKQLAGFFAGGVHDCFDHGEVWVAKSAQSIAGVAAWLPPGVLPATSGLRAVRQGRRAAPSVMRGHHRRIAYKMMNEMTARHPHDDHWYLAILCTDPLFRGRGVGTALLEPILTRADEAGVPTYLETQKESNLAYYGRFGFDVVDTFSIDISPPLWLMQREPR
jgi:GNAT superfamily N-acetyltransferase